VCGFGGLVCGTEVIEERVGGQGQRLQALLPVRKVGTVGGPPVAQQQHKQQQQQKCYSHANHDKDLTSGGII